MLIFINEKILNNKLFLVLMNSSLKKLNRFKEAFKQLFEKPIGLQDRKKKFQNNSNLFSKYLKA